MRYLMLAVAALLMSAAESGAGDWWFSAGPNYRGGMKSESSGTSYAQQLPRTAERSGFTPAPPPPPCSCIPSTFDDGYVRDDGTYPDTWDWGYNNAGQYDPAAETLTFHNNWNRENGHGYRVTPSIVTDRAADFSDRFDGCGLEVSAGYQIKAEKSFQLSVCAGISTVWDARANMSGETFVENVNEVAYTDYSSGTASYVYDVAGISIPSAPYQGSAGGPEIPSMPSSLSHGSPSRYTEITGRREWTNRNRIDMSVDTDIYSFWMGPQLKINAGSRCSLNLTPRISLNYVDVAVERRERLVRDYKGGGSEQLQSWSDHGSDGKLIFGAGITAGVDVELENGLFAGVWGGYEWLSDDVDVDAGPGAVAIDASGYTAGLAAGFRFGGER